MGSQRKRDHDELSRESGMPAREGREVFEAVQLRKTHIKKL